MPRTSGADFTPAVVLIDPATGLPYAASGGGGGGGGYTGATATAPGTVGATATPMQGVTGGVPVPVSQAGAATAAKQPAPGTAGSASPDVLSVQGVANGTALAVAQTGAIPAGSNTIGNIGNTAFGISGNLPAFTTPPNVIDTAAEAALGAPADTAYAGTGSSSLVAALKGVYAQLVAATPAGTNSIGAVTQGQGATGSPWYTATNVSSATGGVNAYSRIPSSSASTNVTTAKASPGRIFKIVGMNTTAATIYLKVYAAISPGNVTVGTTTVVFSRPFPPNAVTSYDMGNIGWYLPIGITYAFTTGTLDSDTTAIGAGAMTQVSVEYQ